MSSVTGLVRVEGKLKGYLAGVQSKVVQGARITQDRICDRARQLVRKRFHHLERSIVPGPIELDGTEVTAWVYAQQDYASYQEYGPKGSKRKWAYTPYLRPAFKEMREFFFKSMKWAMRP